MHASEEVTTLKSRKFKIVYFIVFVMQLYNIKIAYFWVYNIKLMHIYVWNVNLKLNITAG